MEALVFDPKSRSLKYHNDYPMPEILNDDEIIVEVTRSGVCGTDLHIIQGDFPVRNDRPFILGHEFCGSIYAMGKNSTFELGQRVVIDPNSACHLCDSCRSGKYQNCLTAGLNNYTGICKDGGWANYCKVLRQQVYVLPEMVKNEQACFAESLSSIAHTFNRVGPLKVGEKILIIGAGFIGNLFASALHYHGHRNVTVSEKREPRLGITSRMCTYFTQVTPDILEKKKELYDVIIDCSGVANLMETSVNYMKQGGRYIIFGCCQSLETASINIHQIYDKELTIIGVKTSSFTFPTAIKWIMAMGERYLDSKKLEAKAYWLSDYETALEDWRNGRISKIIFKHAIMSLS